MTLLTLARDLRRRKAREKRALFVVEGVRSTDELLRSSLQVLGVISAPQLEAAPRGADLLNTIARIGMQHERVKESEFRGAAETESPQGVLAIAEIPDHSFALIESSESLRLVILDAVQDPGNVGTIVRTAAALGAQATVALPGTVDLWNAKVVRSAMGAHFHHTAFHTTASELFAFLEEKRVELWVAASEGSPLDAFPAPTRIALAFGNEGAGVSSYMRERAARAVSIPISSQVESLNVAVAAGILLYHLR